ncbi:PREDICTED: ATP-binding cassette sub-family F member 2 [Gekko japonicus]|uniref:ATP-binding cassette sub-family F member 2 n=1 Tax=Gekko japonicus TaxID=146911 RepID=A0ABM1L8A4_GEKJA|nr:PREDICTED: ATP-binding cassette sub-family F member 2 [Gekko japonicus]
MPWGALALRRPVKYSSKEANKTLLQLTETLPSLHAKLTTADVDAVTKALEEFELKKAAARAVTGVLASHPNSTDVHIINLSLTFHGQELLSDTKLELNSGRRYGLIGLNGTGKSMLLSAIGKREVPIPEHIDIYHLTREMPPSEKTPLQCVMEVDTERAMLEREAERLAHEDAECEKLMELYERLEELDADKAEMRASRILHGLGFTPLMQRKKLKDFSGGWRMRVALTLSFYFPSCGKIPPPVIMVQNVSFQYSKNGPWIYTNLEFGIDLDTRVALVGPNGAGKSTLLKLLTGEHLQEQLDLDLSPLEYMMKCYPEIKEKEEMRKIIGRYGLTGKQQVSPIRNLSDGQKCRVCFAWLAWQSPHMLFLDEPTNHLDIETIDALADAINDFEGGMMLVSHDFRLIQQVAQEIWVCEKQAITKWQGDILSYKEHLKSKLVGEEPQLTKRTHNM